MEILWQVLGVKDKHSNCKLVNFFQMKLNFQKLTAEVRYYFISCKPRSVYSVRKFIFQFWFQTRSFYFKFQVYKMIFLTIFYGQNIKI